MTRFDKLLNSLKNNWEIERNAPDGITWLEFLATTINWAEEAGYTTQEIEKALMQVQGMASYEDLIDALEINWEIERSNPDGLSWPKFRARTIKWASENEFTVQEVEKALAHVETQTV